MLLMECTCSAKISILIHAHRPNHESIPSPDNVLLIYSKITTSVTLATNKTRDEHLHLSGTVYLPFLSLRSPKVVLVLRRESYSHFQFGAAGAQR